MDTFIFSCKADFEDAKIFCDDNNERFNGVSQEFADAHPNYKEDNKFNTRCWNCEGCEYCDECDECQNCSFCESGNKNKNCYFCHLCSGCENILYKRVEVNVKN